MEHSAFSLLKEASSSLEVSLKESQGALHEQRLQRLTLQDEVIALSSYAAVAPLLEHEVLAQGDRADALEDALRVAVAKNAHLQTFAHLRARARAGLQGAEGLRCLAACLADLALQRAFGLWRWRLPAHSEQVQLQQMESRLEVLARREAALVYDNMRQRRSHKRGPCRGCASAACEGGVWAGRHTQRSPSLSSLPPLATQADAAHAARGCRTGRT